MTFDALANGAYTNVTVAPTPPSSGPSLQITPLTVGRFPAAPFNIIVWPAETIPVGNFRILRVGKVVGNTFSELTYDVEPGSTVRAIEMGDQVMASVTRKTILDVQAAATEALAAAAAKVALASVGIAGGVPALDGEGKVPLSQLPFFNIEPGGVPGQFLSFVDEDHTAWADGLSEAVVEALIKSLALIRGGFHTVTASETLVANTYNNVTNVGVSVTVPVGPKLNDLLVIHNGSLGAIKVVYNETFILQPGRTIFLMGGGGPAWYVVGEIGFLLNGATNLASSNSAGINVYGGAGVPNKPQGTSTALKTGDMYFRSDGGVGTTLYRCTKTSGTEAENWAPIL